MLRGALGFLGGVPPWVWLVIALGLWGWTGRSQLNTLKLAVATETGQREEVARTAETQERAEEAKRQTEKLEVIRAGQKQRQEASDAMSRADNADARVRVLVDKLATGGGQASSDPAAGCQCSAAQTLGELFNDCRARYRALGKEADDHAIPGSACERSYDSLSK